MIRAGSICIALSVASSMASSAGAQDPLDALRRAVELGDSTAARSAYAGLLSTPELRRTYVAQGETLLGDNGMANDAITVLGTLPRTDPVVQYTYGVACRRVRRLHEADAALERAVLADDVSGVPRTLWAWNAVQQFNPQAAIHRAAPLNGPSAEAIRKAAVDMTPASPMGMRFVACAAAALLLVGSAFVLARHRSRDSSD